MPEKPVLVLIGEAHPSSIEQILIMEGRLRVRLKGEKRIVIDRSRDYARSKESVRRINEEIIKKEAEILKKEKIKRLLLERPGSREEKRLYEGFRRTHELKGLKAGIREGIAQENVRAIESARALFVELGLCRPLLNAFIAHHDELTNKEIQPMFLFSQISAAYKAGVYDLVPVDDEEGFRQSGILSDAMYILGRSMQWCLENLEALFTSYSREEIERMDPDYWRIKAVVDKRIEQVDSEREKAIYRNIVENFVPGTALICGIGHLDVLNERLSKRFDIKPYKVGEELFKSIGPGVSYYG